MCKSCWYFVLLIVFSVKIVCGDEIVETTNGKVKGRVMKTLLKQVQYYAFMGIPYAQPPIKELRFLPPLPVKSWSDTLPARETLPCVQYNSNVKKGQQLGTYGTEDCLYLDIFTPRPARPLRPLLVFIHNEYLKYSNNKTKDYSPDFFIEEDIVIATISHRLSVFGFLSLDDGVLQGNSGLRDIVAGLEWIKNNAERFGGDPNRITLMGSQGGAAAVDLLIHSVARKLKLFHSAILQGGSARSSMYLQDGGRDRAAKLASELGIGPGNSEYLLKKLNEVPAKDLLENELKAAPEDYNKEHQRALASFGPIVDGSFITDYPERTESIDVPVMIGFNSREGLDKALEYLVDPKFLSFVNKDFVLLFPERVDYRFDPNDGYYYEAVDDVKGFYFQEGRVTVRNAPEYVTYLGDVCTKPIDSTAKFFANISTSPVFYYHFDFYSDFNENKNDILRLSQIQDGTWGAASGDELCYLFKCPRLKDKYLRHNKLGSEEIVFLRKIVRMWANFARYGIPTPNDDVQLEGLQWPAYTSENREYLRISKKLSVQRNLNEHRFQFWDNFVNKWRQKTVNGVVARARKTDEL